MAKFEAPVYKELGFYVDGKYRKFSGGLYKTEDAAEIAVLESIADAVRVDVAEEVVAEKPKPTKGVSSAK